MINQNVPAPRYVPPTSALAVASMVLGILGVSILALLFGLIAIPDTSNGRLSGRGMAVTGIVLGALGCVGWVSLLAAIGSVSR